MITTIHSIASQVSNDVETITSLMMEALLEDSGIDISNKIEQYNYIYRLGISCQSLMMFLAKVDNVVAGCAMIQLKASEKTGMIENVFVREPFRRMGVATSLMVNAMNEGWLLGLNRMWLECNEMSINLYSKLGWKYSECGSTMEIYRD